MTDRNPNMKFVRRHYHNSPKAGIVYCCSSYELKTCLILDDDVNVKSYVTQERFTIEDRDRLTDFRVLYHNGDEKLIEVKPRSRLKQFEQQIADNAEYAKRKGYLFEVWTEENIGFKNDWDAKKWSDQYLKELTGIDYVAIRKERGVERTKRYYKNKVATDTVDVWCDFCQTTHTALRLTYEKNLKRNDGKYICERHGGHIAGKKPKPKKINPYEAEGKKLCKECEEVLPLESFSAKKNICKKCRAAIYKERYNEKN